jgi:hypothetical protein
LPAMLNYQIWNKSLLIIEPGDWLHGDEWKVLERWWGGGRNPFSVNIQRLSISANYSRVSKHRELIIRGTLQGFLRVFPNWYLIKLILLARSRFCADFQHIDELSSFFGSALNLDFAILPFHSWTSRTMTVRHLGLDRRRLWRKSTWPASISKSSNQMTFQAIFDHITPHDLQSPKLVTPSTTWRDFGNLWKSCGSMLPELFWEFLEGPVMIPWKVFSARFARMVKRLSHSVIHLNFSSAEKIWGTHLRGNVLKPSPRSRMFLMTVRSIKKCPTITRALAKGNFFRKRWRAGSKRSEIF